MGPPGLRSWARVPGAVVAASLVAGLVMAIELCLLDAFTALTSGRAHVPGAYAIAAGAGIFTVPAFLIGLAFPGSVVWFLLHLAGRRSYVDAAVAVALCSSLAATALLGSLTIASWVVAPGAAAGLTLRRIAYRSVPTPRPARPS